MEEDNSIWYQHEGHDRVHTIQEMVDCLLEGHPSIHNKECEKLVSKVQETLSNLYQKIGEWEAPCDVCGEKETYSVHTFCSKCKHTIDDVQARNW